MDKENLEDLKRDETSKLYYAKDILDAAVRANIKIEHIEEAANLFDKTKEKGGDGKDEVRE